MKIIIGSANPAKIDALKTALERAAEAVPQFRGAAVTSVGIKSGVSDQPLDFDEILRGAQNRATGAFSAHADCVLGVGIESGLFKLTEPKLAANPGQEFWMNVSCCALFDGDRTHYGLSPAFTVPPDVTRLVLEEGLDLSRAAKAAGLTADEYVGYGKGIISILTGGVVTRKDYTVQAILMALASLKHS